MNGTFIVSLDFELFWGMQDICPLDRYRDHVMGGRKAIGSLLELFQRHGIHATWATVGMMFAEDEAEAKRYFPSPKRLPSYIKSECSAYRCFGHIPETDQDCFFSPDLIKQIADTPGMEIGSHTFSHYYCREAGQTIDQFEADIQAAVQIAQDKGYRLSSIVLPRNQCDPAYLAVLAQNGFIAYRDEENDWIHKRIKILPLMRLLRLMDVYFPLTGLGGYHPKKDAGMWNLCGSRMYKPRFRLFAFAEGLKLHRIKRQMKHAAQNGLTFHLWWHPHNIGVKPEYHLNQLQSIFLYYDKLKNKYQMRSMNMSEAAKWLEAN